MPKGLFCYDLVVLQLRKNICKFFHILAQFSFSTSEKELAYYHQRVNVRVASRVAKHLKTWDLTKLANCKKILKILGNSYSVAHLKIKF